MRMRGQAKGQKSENNAEDWYKVKRNRPKNELNFGQVGKQSEDSQTGELAVINVRGTEPYSELIKGMAGLCLWDMYFEIWLHLDMWRVT